LVSWKEAYDFSDMTFRGCEKSKIPETTELDSIENRVFQLL